MRNKMMIGVLSAMIPMLATAGEGAQVIFDNQGTSSYSTIRLHIRSAGAGACSTHSLIQEVTHDKGYTAPGEYHVVQLTGEMLRRLCKQDKQGNFTCKADLYMTQDCAGPSLATVTLPIGANAIISPENVGPYHFVSIVDGLRMMCSDGSKNC